MADGMIPIPLTDEQRAHVAAELQTRGIYPAQPMRCTAEATYWRTGLRYTIALRVMFHARPGRAEGPNFPIGHAWTRRTAELKTDEANVRLMKSHANMAHLLTTPAP